MGCGEPKPARRGRQPGRYPCPLVRSATVGRRDGRGVVARSIMSKLWKQPFTVEFLTSIHVGTAGAHLGLEFLEVGDDFVRARVPVDERTRQPLGILHGGVSVLLAETLGSCGAALSMPADCRTVGLDINANHIRAVSTGWVIGTGRPVHRGRSTQVWQIEIVDEAGRLV